MSLVKSASSGAKWMMVSSVSSNFIQLLQITILAHFLTPKDFGLVAMIVVFIILAQMVSDLGFSNSIIYKQDASKNSLSSLYWLNIVAGLVVYVCFIFLSPLIVALYNEPLLFEIIDYAAFIFLIIPIGSQFNILLQKNLQFKLLAILETASSVVGFVVAIILAYSDFGALSVIWGLLIKNGFLSVALFFIGWHNGLLPKFRFRVDDIRQYIGFSSYQLGEKVVKYLNQRAAHLIIGYFLGAQSLGYYYLAFNFSIMPFQMITMVFARVSFPVFSKVQDNNAKLRHGYLFILKLLSMINLPALMGFIVVAPAFVLFLFGEQWHDAIFPLQVLCIVSILQYISNTTNPILLAKGRVDVALKWNLSIMIVQVPLLIIGAYMYGLTGVVLSFLISQLIFTSLSYFLLIRNLIGLGFVEYLMSIVPFFIMSLVMVVIIWLVGYLLDRTNAEVFFLQIASAAALYVLMVLLFKRPFFNEVKHIVLNRS